MTHASDSSASYLARSLDSSPRYPPLTPSSLNDPLAGASRPSSIACNLTVAGGRFNLTNTSSSMASKCSQAEWTRPSEPVIPESKKQILTLPACATVREITSLIAVFS